MCKLKAPLSIILLTIVLVFGFGFAACKRYYITVESFK